MTPTRPPAPLDVALAFPVLPPTLDGIGDHTAQLALALAEHARVRVWTAQPEWTPIPGVEVAQAFGLASRRDVGGLVSVAEADPPDWVLVQFNQFSWGRWGLNPFLPLAVRALRRRCPGVRVAWVAHEDFVPPTSWRFAVMRRWQRPQFRALGRAADLVVFAVEAWAERYGPWFPAARVACLPVPSNVPRLATDPARARRRAGLAPDAFVLGMFGTAGPSRPLGPVREAVGAIVARDSRAVVAYVGPDGATVRAALADAAPVIDAGPLPAAEVSAWLSAMDLVLTPFADGVSARRGSFVAGLQHGLASVTTLGPHTDGFLARAAGAAFAAVPTADGRGFARAALALHDDGPRRRAMGAQAGALYARHFDVRKTARQLVAEMAACPCR